jgi:hypothetical protein
LEALAERCGYWLQSGYSWGSACSAQSLLPTRVRLPGVLLALIFLSVGLNLVFERRSFCSYLPIGGFTGIYAQTAPLEVKIVNSALASHNEKTCYQECPWGLYRWRFVTAPSAGCVWSACVLPQDNIALACAHLGATWVRRADPAGWTKFSWLWSCWEARLRSPRYSPGLGED